MSKEFEEIAKTQETLMKTFKTLRENFEKAEKSFLERREKIILAFQEEQRAEAGQLAQIGKALETILARNQV